jgi:hypothetical protein
MKYLIAVIAIAYATMLRADDAFREDVNADNAVNSADIVSIYHYILSGEGLTFDAADVNGDGSVNSADVVGIYNGIVNGRMTVNDFKPHYETAFSASLPSGARLRLSEHYVRKNSHIHATIRKALLPPEGELEGAPESEGASGLGGLLVVGRGYDAWYGAYVQIDADTVRLFRRTETEEILQRSEAHGLNLTDSLNVSIDCIDTKATIALSAGGRTYTFTHSWNGGGAPFLLNQTGQPLQATLLYANPDFLSDIWLLGDSYLTTSPNRWIYYFGQRGFGPWLADHCAANGAEKALRDFKAALRMGTPRYALWLVGINDRGDIDAPTSRWLSATKEFISICQANAITPVLQTIPCTFITSLQQLKTHRYKSEWVRSSGYRYIDLAAAIGSKPDGTWAEGMQGPDGIHPTAEGAKVMAEQVLKDFPEIVDQ